MIYVTSDLHGYPLRDFLALLDSARFGNDDFLFVLGDVIDRNGDGGVETLRWLTEQINAELILGNHEDMLLNCEFVFDEITDELLGGLDAERMDTLLTWLANGAEPTLNALKKLRRRESCALPDLFDYLREAPLFETVSLPSGDFLLTHAGLGHFEAGKPLAQYARKDLLWNRPDPAERYYDDVLTVFGHTPTEFYGAPGRAFRTDTWIDIDTGAAGGGSPMLLRLDDMKEFYAG